MNKTDQISLNAAKCIGDCLYVDWDQVDVEEFRQGLMGYRPRRAADPAAETAYDGVLLSGRTVLAHMQEIPDYLIRLARLRLELQHFEAQRKRPARDGAEIGVAASEPHH